MGEVLLTKEEYKKIFEDVRMNGYKNGILYVVHNLLNILDDDETISQVSGVNIETIKLIRWDYSYKKVIK